jgi:hypothetical protein
MSSPVIDLPGGSSEFSGWDGISTRLIAEFQQFAAADIVAEVVHAQQSAEYVGTPEAEQYEVVEFMARYALMVRAGEISPSDRLDPERHASPRRL